MTRLLRAVVLRRLAILGVVWIGLFSVFVGPAHAADDASIDHAENSGGQLKLLVSVPGDANVDLGSVSVTLDGTKVDATAQTAANTNEVKRTTVWRVA